MGSGPASKKGVRKASAGSQRQGDCRAAKRPSALTSRYRTYGYRRPTKRKRRVLGPHANAPWLGSGDMAGNRQVRAGRAGVNEPDANHRSARGPRWTLNVSADRPGTSPGLPRNLAHEKFIWTAQLEATGDRKMPSLASRFYPFLVVMVGCLLTGRAAGGETFPIVDTGQRFCFDNRSAIPDPKPGEPFYGHDAQYVGRQPAYRDNGDGKVGPDEFDGPPRAFHPLDVDGDGCLTDQEAPHRRRLRAPSPGRANRNLDPNPSPALPSQPDGPPRTSLDDNPASRPPSAAQRPGRTRRTSG